jgi:hypothetical protein
MNQLKNSEFLFLNQNQSPNPLKKKIIKFFFKKKTPKTMGAKSKTCLYNIYLVPWWLWQKLYIFRKIFKLYIYIIPNFFLRKNIFEYSRKFSVI